MIKYTCTKCENYTSNSNFTKEYTFEKESGEKQIIDLCPRCRKLFGKMAHNFLETPIEELDETILTPCLQK